LALRQSLAVSFLILVGSAAQTGWAEEPVDAVAAGALAAGAPVEDLLNEPGLSEDGPAIPRPAGRPVEQVRESWRSAPPTPQARAAALRRTRLELGLGDLTGPAEAILRGASTEEPEIHTELARSLAPGVPAIQMTAAWALWQADDTGAATQALLDAVGAISDDLGVQLWLLDNLAVVLLAVVLASSLAFMTMAALLVFPHAAHDLGDLLSSRMPGFARTAGLAALLLCPLALGEGVLGVALALFGLGFAYGSRPQRSVLVLAVALLVIGLHPLAQLVSVTTSLVDRDPVAESGIAVARGVATRADLERLEAAAPDDLLAAHALAARARRLGLEEQARSWLDAIESRFPNDPVALANRGNIEMRRGQVESAIDYYERAAALIDSPVLLFNLSQAYASDFRMEEYERALSRAQALGDREVAALSSLDEADLVADLEFPSHLLLDRIRSLGLAQDPHTEITEALAPGRLGERWTVTAGAFALIALLAVLFANRFDHASLCVRCGHRICTRCEDTVWSEEICEDCHHLFHSPEETDPALRMARLQALSVREARLDRVVLAASLIVPGVAGFAARRPDFAMFGLLLFGWALGWLCWPAGVFVDPMMMGSAALICFAIPGLLSLVAYVAVVVGSLVARKHL
jgi:tetratricopeptide (TPR) repeat protein